MDQQPGTSTSFSSGLDATGASTQGGFLSQLLDDSVVPPVEMPSLHLDDRSLSIDYTNLDDDHDDDDDFSDEATEEYEDEDLLANDLLEDKEIYKKYLHGEVDFDQVMAEMHKFSAQKDTKEVSKAKRPKTDAMKSNYDFQVKRKRAPVNRLPTEQEKYLGLAEVALSQRDYEKAIDICHDIIRASPKCPDPYVTLSEIYYQKEEYSAAQNYRFLAAALNPSDMDRWLTLIDIACLADNLKSAISYCRKALRYGRRDLRIRERLAQLFKEDGQVKMELLTRLSTLKITPNPDGEKHFTQARDVASEFYKICETAKAVEAYEIAFTNHPSHGIDVDQNNALKLILELKDYDRAIVFLVRHCGVKLTYMNGKEVNHSELPDCLNSLEKIVKCTTPANMPQDIIVKLIITLIHQDLDNLINDMLEEVIYPLCVELCGDWYTEIADALFTKKVYPKARDVLNRVKVSKNYGTARAWHMLGECLEKLDDLEGAEATYKRVEEMDPQYLDTVLALATVQARLGRNEEALVTLARRREDSEEARRLTYQRCLMLDTPDQTAPFVEEVWRLLFDDLVLFFGTAQGNALLSMTTVRHRYGIVQDLIMTNQRAMSMCQANQISKSVRGVNVDDLWDLYLRLIERLQELCDYERLQMAAVWGRLLPHFVADESRMEQLEALMLTSAMLNGHGVGAYELSKEICKKDPLENQVWNLFNQCVTLKGDLAHNRYIMREIDRFKDLDIVAAQLIHGNNCAMAGSYRYAIAAYAPLYTKERNNPLVSLMMAICFLNLSVQKFVSNQHSLVAQCVAFLNEYRKLRGECQESYYNIARALHHLMLCHVAVPFYEKCLATEPVGDTPEEKEVQDLSKEAAFNLMIMYKKSGNTQMAQYILQRYLRV